MTLDQASSGKIDIAGIIAQTLQAARRNLGVKLGIATLLSGIPNGLATLLQAGRDEEVDPGTAGPLLLLTLLGVIGSVFVEIVIIRMTAREREGGTGALGSDLADGLRGFFPVLGLSILMGLAILLGMLLLLVPGLLLATAWTVLVPVAVLERGGFFATFSRSADLTRGSRWRVLGFWWLLGGCVLLVGIPLMAGFGILAPAVSAAGAVAPLLVAVISLLGGAASMLGATALAILYDELRSRSGEAADGLAPA